MNPESKNKGLMSRRGVADPTSDLYSKGNSFIPNMAETIGGTIGGMQAAKQIGLGMGFKARTRGLSAASLGAMSVGSGAKDYVEKIESGVDPDQASVSA